ncbi:hypothetical protein NPIL_660771, partial [Nephila pilipes]
MGWRLILINLTTSLEGVNTVHEVPVRNKQQMELKTERERTREVQRMLPEYVGKDSN